MKKNTVPENGFIEVFGAREHNLKNIDLKIPRNKLIVFTGLSGSGKSSLAFDTIFAEGQRRYIETFSSYVRQFIGGIDRPDVDKINGLSPVIAIEQKTVARSPRSTVGTITELYDFFRLLFARAATAISYETLEPMVKYSDEGIVNMIEKEFKDKRIAILAPKIKGRKGHYRELFEQILRNGYTKVRVDGKIQDIVKGMRLDRYKIHDIEVVIDRMQLSEMDSKRIYNSVVTAMKQGDSMIMVIDYDSGKLRNYSRSLMCPSSGISYPEPEPNLFSFNSPYGACGNCNGLGEVSEADIEKIIPDFSLSIKEGALSPLGDYKKSWIFDKLETILSKNNFSIKTPIREIDDELLKVILYGNEGMEVHQNDHSFRFEGIINFISRHSEESSAPIQRWALSFMNKICCPVCKGTRLKKEAHFFRIDNKHIGELASLDLKELSTWLNDIEKYLTKDQNKIATEIIKEIRSRLGFILDVGLDYLTLNRSSKSLSGGEAQRIRLATQIGTELMNVLYVLDEPSIGLHQRDNEKLINSLKKLRDAGNTVLVVEHDKDIMMAADYLVDIGPKAGIHGGHIVAQGTPKEIIKLKSDTALYLAGKKKIEIPAERRKGNGQFISIKGATGNTLQKVNCDFPLGTFTVVTGVSGSGKSTLINETLYPILSQYCYHSKTKPMPYAKVAGIENIDKVIEIDQSPIGRTPRSNPATYCGFFTDIRTLFASVPEAKIRGYQAGRFSFNVKNGRCEVCEGGGMRVIEMNFLPDVYVHCEKCGGKRYNKETLEIRYKGKSISDVLNMTVEEACEFFQAVPFIYRKLKVLLEVGLGYITLGQSAVTLSGGEAQRVKLATELGKKDTGKTFYILDEPTTGLHFQDIQLLIGVLNRLVDRGNTVLVIEHNMDVIKVADHIIDLGPEGGSGGGMIQFVGSPEEMIKKSKTHTAKYLALEMK